MPAVIILFIVIGLSLATWVLPPRISALNKGQRIKQILASGAILVVFIGSPILFYGHIDITPSP